MTYWRVFLISLVRVWVARPCLSCPSVFHRRPPLITVSDVAFFTYLHLLIFGGNIGHLWSSSQRWPTLKSHSWHGDMRSPSAKLRWVTQTLTRLYRINRMTWRSKTIYISIQTVLFWPNYLRQKRAHWLRLKNGNRLHVAVVYLLDQSGNFPQVHARILVIANFLSLNSMKIIEGKLNCPRLLVLHSNMNNVCITCSIVA